MKTLEYYYADGTHIVFDKYTIDTEGVIRNVTVARGYYCDIIFT